MESIKNFELYRIILLVFFVIQLISSSMMLVLLDMPITATGFLLSSFFLFAAFFLAQKQKLVLSVHLVSLVFPLVFVFISIYGKLNGEGTSLVYYIAPRFGILVTIILPFLIFGASNFKRLLYATLPALFWFLGFDFFHQLFNLGNDISFVRTDYFLVILGSTAILVLAVVIIYFLQSTNEKFQQLILHQKQELQLVHQKVTDSIDYASRIQKSMLVGQTILRNNFSDCFILFKPKEVVSGDFYWIKKQNNKIFCMVADCTGHGVPGAFVSMLGIAFLNEIAGMEQKSAAKILEQLRHKIEQTFDKASGQGRQDGMDAAFCIFDLQKSQVNYSGAHNPLLVIRNNELLEFKATPNSIGVNRKIKPFENQIIQLQKNDVVYAFSDGYADQLGGPNNRKIMKKTFYDLLKNNATQTLDIQETTLAHFFDQWKATRNQIDDVLVVGIRI